MDRFEQAKQEIKDAVHLDDLVQEYTAVTRRGRTAVALCPFHNEKTPSFTIYPDTQRYKCYGCGVNGDVFSFVMEREGVDFREAMEQLAERANVSLEGAFQGRRSGNANAANTAYRALETIKDWFVGALHAPIGAAARDYLEQRGLMAASEDFAIGFHPQRSGSLIAFAKEHGVPMDVLKAAGLIGKTGREVLAGRVIFPILDERGRVTGFGGRVLPDDSIPKADDRRPKYLNSPESPFFNKRRLLYGLRQVKKAGTRQLVVVEGYTDVIACHLAGFTGTCATLGTALTTDHAKVLERYATEGVVLLFDGDRAGRQAADRAFRELVHTTLPVRIALLPEGVDPADLASVAPGIEPAAAAQGRTQLRELIDGAADALTVWFRLVRKRLDLSMDVNVERVAAECARILGDVESQVRREALRSAMARHLGISDTALRPAPRKRAEPPPDIDIPPPEGVEMDVPIPTPDRWTPVEEAELDLLACVLCEPGLLQRLGELTSAPGPLLEAVLTLVRNAVSRGDVQTEAIVRRLFTDLAERPRERRFVSDAVDRADRQTDPGVAFDALLAGKSRHDAKELARRARQQLQQALAAGDHEAADRLTAEYTELLRRAESNTA